MDRFIKKIGAKAGKLLSDESGVAMMLALVTLIVLALLGSAAIMTSQVDVQIAGNEKVSVQALHAAESGLSQALVMLNESTVLGSRINDPSTPVWGDVNNTWSEGLYLPLTDDSGAAFFNVSVTIQYKKGCPGAPTKVAFYNHTCGFSDSISSTGGSPVYQVLSRAYKGEYSSEIALELTKQQLNFKIPGGFSAAGDVGLTGNITIDGRDHGLDGTVGSATCGFANLTGNKAGIFSNGSTTDGGNSSPINGIEENQTGAPTTPWDALGMTSGQFDSLFGQKKVSSRAADGTLSGYTWVNGDFGTDAAAAGEDIGGNGILVVHNEHFVASEWTEYTEAAGGGVNGGGDCALIGSPAWCDNYNTDMGGGDTGKYEPAKLGNMNGGTFNGIVIADWIDSMQGNMTVNGAVVSLTTAQASNVGAGTVTINYSCEAIESFASGRTNFMLNWQRLYQ